MEGTGQDNRARILDYFKSHTPVFIVTKADAWLGGYISEKPSEFYCYVYDHKELEEVRVIYSDIRVLKPFEGDYSKLPLPEYLKIQNQEQGEGDAHAPATKTGDAKRSPAGSEKVSNNLKGEPQKNNDSDEASNNQKNKRENGDNKG